MHCWSLAWRILSIILLACEISTIVWEFKKSLPLPFFGIGMKTDIFQSCGLCWGFQICWHIECSTFTASFLRIWSSSAGIPSPLLALFLVMLPNANLILHSRMSSSKWMNTPSWLSRSLRIFCIVFLHVLAISKYLLLLLGPYQFCILLFPSLHEIFPLYLFLEEISSLSHSTVAH